MPQVQRSTDQSADFGCRFATTAGDAPPSQELCAFELPGCNACPRALRVARIVRGEEDPMKSELWRAWIARVAHP